MKMTGEYTLYPARWLMLALFSLSTCSNAALWTTFAPISTDASTFFFADTTSYVAINMIALLYQIFYLPGTIMASVLVERAGLRSAVVAGTALTAAGAAVRYTAAHALGGSATSYAFVLCGQALCAVAQPCFVNAPGLLAANWFGANERDAATTVATLFAVIGNAVGQIMPPAMVSSDSEGNVTGVVSLLLSQAILSVVCLLGVYFGFVSHPPTSPSSSTEERDKIHSAGKLAASSPPVGGEPTQPLIAPSASSSGLMSDDSSLVTIDVTVASSQNNNSRALHSQASVLTDSQRADLHSKYGHVMSAAASLLADRNYRLLLLSFGLGLALFNALLTVLNNILSPCGYTEDDAGGFAAALIGAGLLGAAVAGWSMDTYHNYRPLLKGGFTMAAATTFALAACVRADNAAALYSVFALLGLFMIPMLPVMIENSIECTYPVSEELSAGILFAAGNVVGIPVTFLMQYTIDEGGDGACGSFASPVNLLIMAVACMCSLVVMQYQGPYKRRMLEEAKEERRKTAAGAGGAV
mmetsp:Transcript_3261/g.6189  ORF Transcript_3261/g.6189 Transcript_3261/m.6189 type:complete len:527 (-) Transcript_3261:39-1619(-)